MESLSATPVTLPSLPSDLPRLDNTMGAWLIGTFVATLLQGVVYHQTYNYIRLYPHDPRWMKFWVAVVITVETLTTVLTIHTCYYNLITNFFNPTILSASPVWSLKFLPIPASINAVSTQLFFARRVYMIDRRYRLIAIFAGSLILAYAGCYIALSGIGWNAINIEQFLKYSWLISMGCGLLLVGDMLLTTILIYFLRRNRTGVNRTDSMLDIIVMYTISSGLIMCICNILDVAFALAWRNNLIFAGTSIVRTKIHANTFLVSLNARQSLLNRGVFTVDESKMFRSTIVKQANRSDMHSRNVCRIEVPFEVEQHVHVSEGSDTTAIELKVTPGGLAEDLADFIDSKVALERGGSAGEEVQVDIP